MAIVAPKAQGKTRIVAPKPVSRVSPADIARAFRARKVTTALETAPHMLQGRFEAMMANARDAGPCSDGAEA
jgi:hypothetical protein